MAGENRNLTLARARTRDLVYAYLPPEKQVSFNSATLKKKGNRSSKRKGPSGMFMCALCDCIFRFRASMHSIPLFLAGSLVLPPAPKHPVGAPLVPKLPMRDPSIPTLLSQFELRPKAMAGMLSRPIDQAPKTSDDLPSVPANNEARKPDPFHPDSDLGCLLKRFDKGHVPTIEEMVELNSRLIVIDDEDLTEHIMFGGVAECYLAAKLKTRKHSFKVGPGLLYPATNPLCQVIYPIGCDRFTDNFSVARIGGKTYNRFFGKLPVVLVPVLLKFVLQHGEVNGKRDGLEPSECLDQSRRISFGCCGQGWADEYLEGHKLPLATYGSKYFDAITNEDERSMVVSYVGETLVAMQRFMDHIERVKLGKGKPFNSERRNQCFSDKLASLVCAPGFCGEQVDLQVKNLTQSEQVLEHNDSGNCEWCGFSKTLTLCFTWKDTTGEIWSLKVIVNSRASVGEFFDRVLKLTEIQSRIRLQRQSVDHALAKVAYVQRNNGSYQYPNGLDSSCFFNLMLEDTCPWETIDIGEGIMQDLMKLPAVAVRDIFLSGPSTIVHW